MKNRMMKWKFMIGAVVFGFGLLTVGVGWSSALDRSPEIEPKPPLKWEPHYDWNALQNGAPHYPTAEMLCSQPGASASWICRQFKESQRQKRENEKFKSEILSLKQQLKQIQSVVSVLDADRKHRLEKEKRRAERREARRKAREERRRKRKEQEAERERQQDRDADRYRWRKDCGPMKFGKSLKFDCLVP